MRRLRGLVVRRIAWMLVTAWLVLTITFFVFALAPDPNISLVKFAAAMGGGGAAAQEAAVEAYIQRHNYDVPVTERYAKWMANYATFRWGQTLGGEPVTDVLAGGFIVTLTYLLPALLISTLGAVGIGLYLALRQGSLPDHLGTALAYAGYAVPIFFAGEMLYGLLVHKYGMVWLVFHQHHDLYTFENIDQFLLPAVIMTAHLLAVQLLFVRSEVVENLSADFMKALTASGARPRDLARHALRNAAIPLLSTFFAEILTLLYLAVIVIEVVFGLPGFGAITFRAINDRDVALILGVTFVPLFIGIVGNFLQDLAYTVLDPRVEYGEG